MQDRLKTLEQDLLCEPIRISAYDDLPFAIFHYEPTAEFEARKSMRLLATRLENAGRKVHFISLGRLLWTAIDETEGLEALVAEEKLRGFEKTQETISMLLSDKDFFPIADKIVEMIEKYDPSRDVVFILRTAALAPAIYRCAKLLDELHGRTMVPIILFYPGTLEGTTNLRFMGIPEREQTGAYNYRVKIY